MYSRCTLQSRLTVPDALQRLSQNVRPRRSRWEAIGSAFSWDPKNERPFVGTITGDYFRIRRVIGYRNSFLPVIFGRATPDVYGSRIEVVLRVSTPVITVMTIWLAAGVVGAAVGVSSWLEPSDARGLLALLLPAVGCGLILGGFIPEKRKAVKLLRDALDATPDRFRMSRQRTWSI
jgi:hypothetical protein